MFLIIAIFMCILLIYRKEMMTFLSNVLKKDTEERSKMESNKD